MVELDWHCLRRSDSNVLGSSYTTRLHADGSGIARLYGRILGSMGLLAWMLGISLLPSLALAEIGVVSPALGEVIGCGTTR